MITAQKIVCRALSLLGLCLALATQAAPQYDSLVFYGTPGHLPLEAVEPGLFYTVEETWLANPSAIETVVVHDPAADTSMPFMADIYGVAASPTPYIFLASDVLWDPAAGGTLVPDTQDVYDATRFLDPEIVNLGYRMFFEQAVKVPDGGSTLLMLMLGLGGIAGFLRRR